LKDKDEGIVGQEQRGRNNSKMVHVHHNHQEEEVVAQRGRNNAEKEEAHSSKQETMATTKTQKRISLPSTIWG
jgi:hypothetical protein